jgi:hypothetical protein
MYSTGSPDGVDHGRIRRHTSALMVVNFRCGSCPSGPDRKVDSSQGGPATGRDNRGIMRSELPYPDRQTSLDTQIKRNVEEELRWDPNIDVNDIIGVAVKDGIVTLTGFVRRYNDIFEAEGAAKHVAGVIGVVNDLELRLLGEDERRDTDSANDAIAMLTARSS